MLVCSGVVHRAPPDSSGTLGMHAGLANTKRWLSSYITDGTSGGVDDRHNARRSTAATPHASLWRWLANRESMVAVAVVVQKLISVGYWGSGYRSRAVID